jgi:hypothetical protein
MEREIEIRVGEKRIGLSAFPRQVLLNTLLALLGTLKGVETDKQIQIRIGAASGS